MHSQDRGGRSLWWNENLSEPDRIVGELLQPGGVAALGTLGLNTCLEGIDATPVKGYHLFWKGEQATFWFCPLPAEGTAKKSNLNDVTGQPSGRSFHHGKFVARLRSSVANEPNVTLLEATALELLRDASTGAVLGAICARCGGSPDELCARIACGLNGHGITVGLTDQFCSIARRSPCWRMDPCPISAHNSHATGPRRGHDSGVSK